MTRTGKYKLIYFAAMAGCIAVVGATAFLLRHAGFPRMFAWVGLLLLMLVPGLLQRHYWSDMLAGLHYLNQKNYALSKVHSERFLVQLRERPWLKRLIWLGTSSYSRDVEAMARNNLGAAMVKLGESDAARAQLTQAMALDPECPLPYRNMGMLLLHTATLAEAQPWLEKAVALGLNDGWSDRVVRASQNRHAGRAVHAGLPPLEAEKTSPQRTMYGAWVVEIMNDDRTPFDFAVACLEQAFALSGVQAIEIAKAVDRDGHAACASFDTEADAQAAAEDFRALGRRGGFDLRCGVKARTGAYGGS